MDARAKLNSVRTLHTVVWAFLVVCIAGIPVAAHFGMFRLSFALFGVVVLEVLVLAANGMRCPLTDVAARYTDDRSDNFDIFLPLAVARYNKHIFGPAFLAGSGFSLARWLGLL